MSIDNFKRALQSIGFSETDVQEHILQLSQLMIANAVQYMITLRPNDKNLILQDAELYLNNNSVFFSQALNKISSQILLEYVQQIAEGLPVEQKNIIFQAIS